MSLSSQGIGFGAFTPIPTGGDALEAINTFEQQVNRRIDVVNNFRKPGGDTGDFAKARTSMVQSSGAGRVPMVTWEPLTWDSKPGAYTLDRILAGDHDEHLRSWAIGLAEIGKTTYWRPMHEMNGTWYHWSGDPELYKAVWQHMYSIFAENGATNVKFVWCPNHDDGRFEDGRVIRMEKYWPGSAYVDVLGIDGYNGYSGWRSFRDINIDAYRRVCALDGSLPVWICETATSEAQLSIAAAEGHSKPEWIRDMFATEGMDRVRMLMWFNQKATQFDWRVNTTTEALDELRRQLAKCSGYVAPPPPYVPPVPDRVAVTKTSPGVFGVTWRQVPSFARGYRVYVDGRLTITVLKPTTSAQLLYLAAGEHTITVASFTSVRQSAHSAPVTVVAP